MNLLVLTCVVSIHNQFN